MKTFVCWCIDEKNVRRVIGTEINVGNHHCTQNVLEYVSKYEWKYKSIQVCQNSSSHLFSVALAIQICFSQWEPCLL